MTRAEYSSERGKLCTYDDTSGYRLFLGLDPDEPASVAREGKYLLAVAQKL